MNNLESLLSSIAERAEKATPRIYPERLPHEIFHAIDDRGWIHSTGTLIENIRYHIAKNPDLKLRVERYVPDTSIADIPKLLSIVKVMREGLMEADAVLKTNQPFWDYENKIAQALAEAERLAGT